MITSKQGNPIATFLICLFVVSALSSMAAFADNDTREGNALTTLEVEPVSRGMIEPDLDQVSSGTLFFSGPGGSTMAPLLNASVQINISGIVAKIVVEQTFFNNSTQWLEGLYTFPLPDQAAVNAMEVTIGTRRITGKIREKEQAIVEFANAKQEGKVASLVSQHRPNLFSSRFANIAPGEKIALKLTYIQTVPFENAKYRLRIPLTLTPRFSNSLVPDKNAITSPFVDKKNGLDTPTIDHTATIEGLIHGEYDEQLLSSPSHPILIDATVKHLGFSTQNPVKLDRDFILEWGIPNGTEPTVRTWKERVGDQYYLLSSVVPPASPEHIPQQARELILVIDTSGSMAGEAIKAAKAALMNALAGLRDIDQFNIIEFNSHHTSLFSTPQPVNADTIAKAQRFVYRLRADGGTEMLSALQSALGYQHTENLRQVVFITDGSVGYEDSVITTVTKQLRSARLFTVGIGSAPNQWFMRKVAQAGRGTAEFIADTNDVAPVMGELLLKLEAPALTDITVAFDDPKTNYLPNPIPDLYANDAVIIAAKLESQYGAFTLSGRWGDTLWQQSSNIDNAPLVQTGLSTIWAQRTIASLEDQQRLQIDQDFYRSAILGIALEHNLLSKYTSFLAVEEQPARPKDEYLHAAKVPNLIPHGNDMLTISMPQGSAGSDTLIMLSMLLMLLAAGSIYSQRRFKRH